MTQEPVVIIGSGLAGYTVAREFRKLDAETPVVILSADHGITAGTRWDDIPESWECPDCGIAKSDFKMAEI